MQVANIAWWILYIAIAIVLQSSIPGVDFFIPAYIIAIQERKIWQFVWVLVAFVFLQEGMGTLPFGSVLLWYATIVGLYIVTSWLFEAESLPFLILLSIALSIAHYAIIVFMCTLAGAVLDRNILLDECVYQMFLTPFIWQLAKYTRKGTRYAS